MGYRRRIATETLELRNVFHRIDKRGTGYINSDEFTTAMTCTETVALLEKVGVDVRDAAMFFRVLEDLSDESMVSYESFVDGCLYVRGSAAALDIQVLRYEVRELTVGIQRALRFVHSTKKV